MVAQYAALPMDPEGAMSFRNSFVADIAGVVGGRADLLFRRDFA
jgi:hypothetical protein